jgi:hypothetical protein
MQTPFVKMMSRISEIENYILKGLVLDDHGAWIPIADKKAVEEDFLAHLIAGQVLNEGRWVSIPEAKTSSAPTEIATIATEMPVSVQEKKEPAGATAAVTGMLSDETSTDALPSQATFGFPPETKSIIIERTNAQPSNPLGAEQCDPQSGYAPETGAFVLEQSDETEQGALVDGSKSLRDNLKESSNSSSSTASSLLPTVTLWEQSTRKRHMQILIYGTIGVVIAGAAAIVVLVIQLTR